MRRSRLIHQIALLDEFKLIARLIS
jgi:hypothetical protein